MPNLLKVLDIEAVGEPWDGKLICVGWGTEAYATPLPPQLLRELADPNVAKVVFTKYDHRWLRLAGYVVAGPIIDVQVMAWALNETIPDLSLETCTQTYTPHEIKRKRIRQIGGVVVFECDDGTVCPLIDAPIEDVLKYNKQDLTSTLALFNELRRLLYFDGQSDHLENDLMPFTSTLVDVECAGVPVDVEEAKEFAVELEQDISTKRLLLKAALDLPEDFNLNSNDQLAKLLYEKSFNFETRLEIDKDTRTELKQAEYPTLLGMDVTKVGTKYATVNWPLKGLGLSVKEWTDTRKPATDAKTLKIHHADNEVVQKLIEISSVKTLAQTTLPNIVKQSHNGRLYGRFNQTGTKTGRLSSNSPNMQNIPAQGPLGKRARGLFKPESGMLFVHGDYSQLEPRLMAHFSHDPVLTEIYLENRDIYVETAMRIFRCDEQEARDKYRSPLKVFVLALGYGSGAETIQRSLALYGHRIPLHEVEDTLRALKDVYRVFWQWKDEVIASAESDGYVETLSGHRRHFFNSGKPRTYREMSSDDRQAVNAVIQGSAADIVSKAMMNSAKMFPQLTLLLQVHDELLWETRETELGLYLTKEVLGGLQDVCENQHGYSLTVPLVFEPKVVKSWAEGKE